MNVIKNLNISGDAHFAGGVKSVGKTITIDGQDSLNQYYNASTKTLSIPYGCENVLIIKTSSESGSWNSNFEIDKIDSPNENYSFLNFRVVTETSYAKCKIKTYSGTIPDKSVARGLSGAITVTSNNYIYLLSPGEYTFVKCPTTSGNSYFWCHKTVLNLQHENNKTSLH